MDVFQAIRKRRSIREYKRKAIPPKAIEDLIDALRWAPSAGNLQSRFFYFVFDKELRKQLARSAWEQMYVAQAPLAVVACMDPERIEDEYGERGVELYAVMDVAASIQNLMLVAESEGLGTCWVGALEEEEVREILEIPDHLRPVSIVAVGYPAEQPEPPDRLEVEESVEIVR